MSFDIPVLLIKVDLVGSSWYSVRLDTIDEASDWLSGKSSVSLLGSS